MVTNNGTKKWKHVKLVHVSGLKPVLNRVNVPEVQPGMSVELVVQYPALQQHDDVNIKR